MGMSIALTDLPNIGKAIASDLQKIGICSSSDFEQRSPMMIFEELLPVMGERHDPCVYYTLLSVKHFLNTGEPLPWWKFTDQGKRDLQAN